MRQVLSALIIDAVDWVVFCNIFVPRFFLLSKTAEIERKIKKIIAVIKLNNNAVCFDNPLVVLLFCFWFIWFCFCFYSNLRPYANCGLKIST